MLSDDYNIISELTRFQSANSYKSLCEVINDMKILFSKDKICKTVLETILNKPESYITNIINYKKQVGNIIRDIIPCLFPGSVSVYSDSNILENGELINCYYIYSNIDNVNVYTTNELDYCACILNYVNNVYDTGDDDILFTSLLANAQKRIHFGMESSIADNYVLISNKNVIKPPDDNTLNVLAFYVNDRLKTDEEYKESIMNVFTPTDIVCAGTNYTILKMIPEPCKLFSIHADEDGEYLYNKFNNWLTREKPEIEVCPKGLLIDLQTFEFRCRLENEYNKMISEIVKPKHVIDFENTFQLMSVTKDILDNVRMKSYILGDIMTPYKGRPRTKKTSYLASYPRVSGTTANNGVAEYVNHYTIDTKKPLITVCLRKNATGFATVHIGKFSTTQGIAVFSLHEKTKLNPYNVAFSITESFKHRTLKNGLTVDRLMKSKVKILL